MQTTSKMEIVSRNPCPQNIADVLVVDDDLTALSIAERMIKTLHYAVRAAKDGFEAMLMLRKHNIDLVIADIYMPKMDGFELLKLITEEFNIPVILMSVDHQEKLVLRTLEMGAVFFISKPVTMADIRNIWQYPLRKKMDYHEKITIRSRLQIKDNNSIANKRKVSEVLRIKDKNNGGEENVKSPDVSKKPKIVWNEELHKKFLGAIEKYGLEGAVPKKILTYMKVPGLTRENIASHLQKHRINLKKDAAGIKSARRRRWESSYNYFANRHQVSNRNNVAGKTLKANNIVTSLTTSLNNRLNFGVPSPLSNNSFSFYGGNKRIASSSNSAAPSVFDFQAKGKQPLFPASRPLQNRTNYFTGEPSGYNRMNYFTGEPSGYKAVNPAYGYQFGNRTDNSAMEMNFGVSGVKYQQTLSNYGQQKLLVNPVQHYNNGERLLQGPAPAFDSSSNAFFNGTWNNSSSGFMGSGTNQFQMLQNDCSFQQPQPQPLELPAAAPTSAFQWNNVTYPQLQQQHLDLPPLQNHVCSSSNNILPTTCNLDAASGFESLLVEEDLTDTFWKQININADYNQVVPQQGVVGESAYLYNGPDFSNGGTSMLVDPNHRAGQQQHQLDSNYNEVNFSDTLWNEINISADYNQVVPQQGVAGESALLYNEPDLANGGNTTLVDPNHTAGQQNQQLNNNYSEISFSDTLWEQINISADHTQVVPQQGVEGESALLYNEPDLANGGNSTLVDPNHTAGQQNQQLNNNYSEISFSDTLWEQINISADHTQVVSQQGVEGESALLYHEPALANGGMSMLVDPNHTAGQQKQQIDSNNNEVSSPEFSFPVSFHVEEIPPQTQNQVEFQQGIQDGQVDEESSPEWDELLAWFQQDEISDVAEALAGLNWDQDGNNNN